MVSHPSEALSITAHENRTIRFLDNKTGTRISPFNGLVFRGLLEHVNIVLFFFSIGKVVHSMVAHLDAVTCLTTDPKGTYLISGSELQPNQ